jgi:hypothetical protein
MEQYSGLLKFRIDPSLSPDMRKVLDILIQTLKDAEKSESLNPEITHGKLVVEFVSENSLPTLSTKDGFRICMLDKNQGLFSFGQDLNGSATDAFLDENIDLTQLSRLITPSLNKFIQKKQEQLNLLGLKNLKNYESKSRQVLGKKVEFSFTTDSLLNYTQSLVDLERELIQSDNISQFEKVLKQFTKINIEKSKFRFISLKDLSEISPDKDFLPLPSFKGEFVAVELNWDESDPFKFIKKLFFYYTLINFFKSQSTIEDPFFDETLWSSVLDAIPFPVALLSKAGEIHRHNSLFSNLGFPPVSCLNLKLREKILINDIPYNIFRKDLYHNDSNKVLFVFFTESFFLKGDGNLTPSGQELGIISSSIAHELNNPIAGIQAALSLLLLDESLDTEEKQTLLDMKNGSLRCKQLVETFLGFSRANPRHITSKESSLGPIEICYQQAQNLLRFRTVESGIRFNFESIKHADFRTQVNPSLLTMTFYLILGELMTLYSHQMLLINKNQIEKVIKGEIIESSHEIQIQLHELNISTLVLSKLIQNLLNIENFVLQVSDYSLRFIYNPK